MISIARKNLFAERTRFLISVSGVAFSILLMSFLMGVYSGISTLAVTYINHSNADIVVAQEGVKNMFHSFSLLSKSKISQIERVTGGKAYGIVSRGGSVLISEEDGSKIVNYPGRLKGKNKNGKRAEISIIGYDTHSDVGGPWITVEGNSIPGDKEIIVDAVFAKKNHLTIGDNVEAFDEIFKVTGITTDNNMLTFTRAFTSILSMQEVLKEKDTVNYIFVKLPDPSQKKSIAEKLQREVTGISAYTREEFAVSNGETITDSFLPIIAVITVLGFLTGAIVIGLMVYTSTLEKIREFGILKAIGASNTYLFLVVLEQSFISSLIGFAIGSILTVLIAKSIGNVVPALMVDLRWEIFTISFISSLVMSLLASYIPVRRVFKLDPASVFKQ